MQEIEYLIPVIYVSINMLMTGNQSGGLNKSKNLVFCVKMNESIISHTIFLDCCF